MSDNKLTFLFSEGFIHHLITHPQIPLDATGTNMPLLFCPDAHKYSSVGNSLFCDILQSHH